MENSEARQREPAASRSLREAIKQARLKEAVNIDLVADRRSSELARLEVLKAALEPVFDEVPEGEDRFDLALVPSVPARLWIDMFTYVTMDSTNQIYRLVRNGRNGRRVLGETREVGDMRQQVTDYIAQQIVDRERQLNGLDAIERRAGDLQPEGTRSGSRAGTVIAAFLVGFLTAVFGMLALVYLTPQ